MPIRQAITNFHEKHGVQLDETSIKTAVSNILGNHSDPEVRERLLKEYVKNSFRDFAIPLEQQRQSLWIGSHGYSLPTMEVVGMLDAYIGVVSQIALIASGEQIESMQKAQAEAKASAAQAVENAKIASDAANKAREAREYGANQKIEEANELVRKANLRLERANNPDNFYFKPWEPGMPKFGLTSAEARAIYLDCVNSVKFAELRSEEMRESGAEHWLFAQLVNEIDQDTRVTDYNSATPKDQEKLRNVYVTRELMNTHLDGLKKRNWIWRLIHRSEIKAVQNYVNSADNLLTKVNFPEDLKASTMTAATTGGIRAGFPEVEAGLQEIDQAFAEVDKAVEARNQEKLLKAEENRKIKEERQKEKEEKQRAEEKAKKEKTEKHATRKAREEQAKKAIVGHEAEINAEAEALARMKKELPDAFFDIRFRPSWDKEESKRQSDLAVQIGKEFFTGKRSLPAGVEAVFKANYAKIRAVREFVKKDLNTLEPKALQEKIKELDTQFAVSEEMVKIEHEQAGIKYEPVTFDQLKLQHDLAKDLSSNVVDAKSAAPVVPSAPQKEFEQPNP